nr:transposase [Actinopolyspora biskrensis]
MAKSGEQLHLRTWTCSGCGTTRDRDLNAASNIEAAGLAVHATGCGSMNRLGRRADRPGARGQGRRVPGTRLRRGQGPRCLEGSGSTVETCARRGAARRPRSAVRGPLREHPAPVRGMQEVRHLS